MSSITKFELIYGAYGGLCAAEATLDILLLIRFFEYWNIIVLVSVVLWLFFTIGFVFVVTNAFKPKITPSLKYINKENFDSMEGKEFEDFCAAVLIKNGFKDVRFTKGSGDHGIDIIAKKDRKKYAIQCKRYSNPVGNKAIQEAYSGKAIYKADVAVVLTNSFFTKQAIEDAKMLKVQLWNRNKLLSLVKKLPQ